MDNDQMSSAGTATSAEEDDNPIRKLFLAWLGAMATAYDASEQTFDQFVQRGRRVQDEVREKANDVRAEAPSPTIRTGDSFQMLMTAVRDQLNIPSKTELDAVNVKLNIILRKLDDLALSEEGPEAPDVPEPPEDLVT